jgi:signal transduction histidine kinase
MPAVFSWWLAAVVVGLIAAEAGLILALLVQRRRRREAQARLAERLRFEALVSGISAALTTAPVPRIDAQIRECLQRVVTSLGVDRAALWRPRPDGAFFEATHAWVAADGAPPPTVLDMRMFPYFVGRMKSLDGGLSFEHLDELPPEAAAERAAFAARGIRSFAAIPVHVDDHLLGYLGIASVRAERAWPTDVVHQFRSLAECFAHALVRARSAAAVRTSVALTQAVLAVLPGETAIVDASGTILQTNEAWASAARGAPASAALAVGANYLDACRDAIGLPAVLAKEVEAGIASVLRGDREDFSLEYPIAREGRDRWFEVRVRRVAHLHGGAAVTHLDVTRRREDEAAARRALGEIAHLDRVAAMGHLATSIAHELNQPLAAILTNAQAALRLMANGRLDVDELRACLADIVSDDQRAAEVIRRMRRLLRKTDVVVVPFALGDLVASTIGLVANDALLRGVSIDFKPAAALPVIHGDLVQIQQVILNLLTNAIAAAAEGVAVRTVTVWTAPVSPDVVELGVHDSGPGITNGDRHRLFEPFFTTKPDGLGMGLAIVHKIVEAHSGELHADNDPAGGATFRVHLRNGLPVLG